ncbi:MAG: ABC transporter ATP-binding protein [Proteobacteria bacterium]|nr:ABC transporter ATP-binding protein [Pseudomonadota bacterium]
MKAIEAKGLKKAYGPVVALRDVTFSVEPGEVIGLLGPNGAGKTTLMKVLTGYLEADKGYAKVAGIDVGENALEVQSKIGYLPENAPLYREMTVQEYLLTMAALRSIPEGKRLSLLADAIGATGLGEYLARPIGQLSKGYRQRVGLAQALLHHPPILILDEPTTGLDPNQIVEIRELIQELSRDTTVILSTHILSEVEMSCERVLIIMQGKLHADAKLDELRAVNAAVVAIESKASGVENVLRAISGVDKVERRENVGEYQRWRVTSEKNPDLCPAVYDAVRDKNWRLAELRSDARTLESVFRELAESPKEALA